MRIAMIGGGYVGLVSGACFAEFGVDVAVVEADPGRLAALRGGRMPIYEPGLEDLVRTNVAAGRLTFGDDLAEAMRDAEAVFIAVGTPTRRGDGHADLSYVYAAAEQVARSMTGYAVIVTKSTVPVGTGRRIAEIVRATRPDLAFDVASNPEFLREGNAIGDFMKPDRVVIGADSAQARATMQRLYAPIAATEAPILFTGIETAELTKYAANAFLAMKVTFINEMADLCERAGADVLEAARALLPWSVTYCRDALDAAQGADATVLITEWNQFRALSPARLAAAMRGRVLIDLRNIYDPVAMRRAGLEYHGIGRA